MIQSLGHDGDGIGVVKGKRVFVAGALVGERVKVEVSTPLKRQNRARLIDVIEPCASRQTPKCALFERCGGCQLQHANIDTQRNWKRDTLADNLSKAGIEVEQWLDLPVGPEFGYRRRARLAVDLRPKTPLIGFRAKQSNQVVDVANCPVLTDQLNDAIRWIRSLDLELLKLNHVELYEVLGGTGVSLHLADVLPDEVLKSLFSAKPASFKLKIYANKRFVLGDEWLVSMGGQSVEFKPGDFMQANESINRQMVDCALEWLQPTGDDTIYDLFCGLGNFSFPLASRSHKTVGIEGSDVMTQRARAVGVERTEFKTMNLFDEPLTLPSTVNKVLLDPPRSGAEAVCELLAREDKRRVVYVSCDPTSFVRDVRILTRGGYTLKKLGVLDMFPHSTHSECVALLA
jgi:23S rRNA (uracil1939-C5)-methyltransferase